MNKFDNFDVYKMLSPKIKGYIFSVLEKTDEEPVYHYYFVQVEHGKQPSIRKPNNIIDILHSENLEMIDINEQPDEYATFTATIERILQRPLVSLEKNTMFSNVTSNDLQLLRRH